MAENFDFFEKNDFERCVLQLVHHFCDGFKSLIGRNSLIRDCRKENSSDLEWAPGARSIAAEFSFRQSRISE